MTNLPDKLEPVGVALMPDGTLQEIDGASVNDIIKTVNALRDYLAERDRLPWDVSLLGHQTVTRYEQGAGGCCPKCEIYLDYKDDYQCSDDTCECHQAAKDANATIHYNAGYTKGFKDGQQKMSEALDEEMDKFIKGFGYRKKI